MPERAKFSGAAAKFVERLYNILEYYDDIILSVSRETSEPEARPLDDALGFDLVRI